MNLPAHEIIAQESNDDLEAPLEQFAAIEEDVMALNMSTGILQGAFAGGRRRALARPPADPPAKVSLYQFDTRHSSFGV